MEGEKDEVSEEVLEEGSYHLHSLGMTDEQIAEQFETTPAKVAALIDSYASKLKSGLITTEAIDRVFWEDVRKEAEGDMKLTFLSDKGFHPAWKSELSKLDGRALMSVYEASKDFLNADPNKRFLDYPPPKGYDPLAMEREVRKSVEVIGELLAEKWEAEKSKTSRQAANT